jgi:hypothetical protein
LASASETAVRIDQFLYGYRDGHRLLAASRELPDIAASQLLVHSDAVAGTSFDEYGYWTGLPLPSARAYALMRTWPAPEMPRPGCVWTHVLLVASADMARFADMQTLSQFAARPSGPPTFSEYGAPILAEPTSSGASAMPITYTDALQILRALYAVEPQNTLPRLGREQESALFAVWSQQWPRLRRSFSFQTAGFAVRDLQSKFDLRLVDDPIRVTAEHASEAGQWESSALDDLREPGDFRRFIWRYGSDVRRGRERFRFLAELFVVSRQSTLHGDTLAGILNDVVHTLPEPDDGRLLKADLVASGERDFSLMPSVDPLDALDYLLRTPQPGTLPSPSLANISGGDKLWPARAAQILAVLERALVTAPSLADDLVRNLASHVDARTFFVLSKDHPDARSSLVAANPHLLDSPGIEEVPQPQLDELLRHLPDDTDLAGRVLDRLLVLDDALVARTFASRFPSLTAERVFDAIARHFAQSRGPVPQNWITAIRPTLRAILPAGMLPMISTTSALAACAVVLDLDVSAGLASSSADWAAVLARSRDDVTGASRQRLMAYLLALALAEPVPGCELLFERAFEPVHSDIAASLLPYDAFSALARYLPNLYWWQQSDTCLRLRTAVAQAYASNELSPKSFRLLTSDSTLFEELVDQVSHAKHGRRFIKRLGNT